jgi:radical SAM protein with 4Fe4S-binding SPASM domain
MEQTIPPAEPPKNELRDPEVVPKHLGPGKAFCRAAFESLHIAIGGATKPCCEFKDEIANLKEATIEEIWQSEALKELRAKMLRDEWDARCWKCYEAEEAGGVSLREMYNSGDKRNSDFNPQEQLATPILRTLDLRFSNLCNLSCRTCGPDSSTKWHADAKRLSWWNLSVNPLNETFASHSAALKVLSSALDTLEGIYFAGGEPLLHEGHYALLQHLIDRGRTDLALTYNTNLTALQLGRIDVLPLWSKFKYVSIGASIDGHERRGELIREGLSWDKFVGNVTAIRNQCPHVQIYFAITVSVFNILSLPALCRRLRDIDPALPAQFRFNILQEPRHYSIQILPADMKKQAARGLANFGKEFSLQDQVKPVIDFMLFEDRSDEIATFRSTTLCLDELRRRDTAETIPELAPLLRQAPKGNFYAVAKRRLQALARAFRGPHKGAARAE